jgi:hypothetical protein
MFVKDMADLFPAYDDEDARECIEGDFASLGAERGGAVLRPRGRHSRGLHAGRGAPGRVPVRRARGGVRRAGEDASVAAHTRPAGYTHRVGASHSRAPALILPKGRAEPTPGAALRFAPVLCCQDYAARSGLTCR